MPFRFFEKECSVVLKHVTARPPGFKSQLCPPGTSGRLPKPALYASLLVIFMRIKIVAAIDGN